MAFNPNDYVRGWLNRYGHFENPAMPEALDVAHAVNGSARKPALTHKGVKEAVQSIQRLDAQYEMLWRFNHGDRSEPPYDGEVDEVTMQLMGKERCSCKDYGPQAGPEGEPLESAAAYSAEADEWEAQVIKPHLAWRNGEWVWEEPMYPAPAPRDNATGSNSWPVPGCDPKWSDRETVHAIRAYLDASRATSTQSGYLDWCKLAAQMCCAEAGLRIRWVESADIAECASRFENIPGGVIGWNHVYPLGRNSCGLTMHGRLDRAYSPADRYMFAILLIHEMFGHGLGHAHTRGGIMNPSIIRTPAGPDGYPSYRLDRSGGNAGWRRMVSWFGGERVDLTDKTTPPVDPVDPTDPTPRPVQVSTWIDRGETYTLYRGKGQPGPAPAPGPIIWPT